MDELTDDERDAQVIEHYERNRPVYDGIQAQLDAVRETVETAPIEVAQTVLFLADTYALISANTRVEPHELAFSAVVAGDPPEEALPETRGRNQQWAVMYGNNKAEYVRHNQREVDYRAHVEAYRDGRYDELHRLKVDEVRGLGARKGAFALAMAGVTEKMCVDSRVAGFFGLDPNDPTEVPETVVIDRYEAFCADLRARAPTILDRVTNYGWQWVAFDVARQTGVTTHDPWFLAIETTADRPIMTPS